MKLDMEKLTDDLVVVAGGIENLRDADQFHRFFFGGGALVDAVASTLMEHGMFRLPMMDGDEFSYRTLHLSNYVIGGLS